MTYLPELRASLVQAAREKHADAPEPPRRRGRRRLSAGGLATALAAATAVAVAAVGLIVLGHRNAHAPSASSPAGIEAAVRRSADQKLRQLALPTGAVVSGLVKGTPANLWSPSSKLGIPGAVDVYRIWRLHESPDRVIRFIESHRPPGGLPGGYGTEAGSGSPGKPMKIQMASTVIAFPATASGIWRQLAINAVALRAGGTALRVDSEAGWLAPRSAAQRIPAGVARVRFEWLRRHPAGHERLVIRRPAQVRTLVSLFNSVPSARSEARICKHARNGILRFAFQAAGDTAPLAVVIWAPPCRELTLTIRGGPSIPLMAGSPNMPIGEQIAEILVRLAPPRRVTSSLRAGGTIVNSGQCVSSSPPGPSPSAHGAAGASCASVRSSAKIVSAP